MQMQAKGMASGENNMGAHHRPPPPKTTFERITEYICMDVYTVKKRQ